MLFSTGQIAEGKLNMTNIVDRTKIFILEKEFVTFQVGNFLELS